MRKLHYEIEPLYLQTHDELFYARHPKCNVLSTRTRKHVNVDGQRELAVVIRHRWVRLRTRLHLDWIPRTFCQFSKLSNHRRRQCLTVQRVKQRVNPALEIVNQAPLRSLKGRPRMISHVPLAANRGRHERGLFV